MQCGIVPQAEARMHVLQGVRLSRGILQGLWSAIQTNRTGVIVEPFNVVLCKYRRQAGRTGTMSTYRCLRE